MGCLGRMERMPNKGQCTATAAASKKTSLTPTEMKTLKERFDDVRNSWRSGWCMVIDSYH